jgi:hypothetical protein
VSRCVWMLEGRTLRARIWRVIREATPEERRRRKPTWQSIGNCEYRLAKYVPASEPGEKGQAS